MMQALQSFYERIKDPSYTLSSVEKLAIELLADNPKMMHVETSTEGTSNPPRPSDSGYQAHSNYAFYNGVFLNFKLDKLHKCGKSKIDEEL